MPIHYPNSRRYIHTLRLVMETAQAGRWLYHVEFSPDLSPRQNNSLDTLVRTGLLSTKV